METVVRKDSHYFDIRKRGAGYSTSSLHCCRAQCRFLWSCGALYGFRWRASSIPRLVWCNARRSPNNVPATSVSSMTSMSTLGGDRTNTPFTMTVLCTWLFPQWAFSRHVKGVTISPSRISAKTTSGLFNLIPVMLLCSIPYLLSHNTLLCNVLIQFTIQQASHVRTRKWALDLGWMGLCIMVVCIPFNSLQFLRGACWAVCFYGMY